MRIPVSVCLAMAALGWCAGVFAQQAPGRSVWDGVYTEEQATRGKALY